MFGRASPDFNFQNVDAVYDGLLDLGQRPFVEMSFMRGRLASGTRVFGNYKANVTPPQSLTDWQDFVRQFTRHLIERYGAAEVRQWPFEVWNESNLAAFWSGTQADYFELYRATATAVKSVDPAIRVGGPSTSAVQWIPEFLAFCAANDLPLDFVSTHVYAGDNQTRIFGEAIDASKFKGAELWLGEWSSDSPAMIAHVITGCLPYCHAMSQWQLSGTYEELQAPSWVFKEGDNGWGLLSRGSVPRSAFNTYKLMNRLGHRRLQAAGPALATRRAGGGAAVLVWNLAEVQQPAGIPGASSDRKVVGGPKRLRVSLQGANPGQAVKVSYVDQDRGSPYPTWRALGSPKYPTRDQMAKIRAAAELAPPEIRKLGKARELVLDLPPEGVALIELGSGRRRAVLSGSQGSCGRRSHAVIPGLVPGTHAH
ncbi:hypothetical protein LJR225_000697 [Phenylobacterium sp. LjRoot225]|uniref:GH39 family glycosyl hydrolase n=1 Tax=Phenylobacterium sp. LjRoot225 TaxID=3342285 RepID=UPI003ECDD41B